MTIKILVPCGALADPVRDKLHAWIQAGLVEDAILADEKGVILGAPEQEPSDAADLATRLAEMAAHEVELLAIRASTDPAGSVDDLVVHLRNATATSPDAVFVSANLLVPTFRPPSRGEWRSISDVWDHNFVIIPEDRADDAALAAQADDVDTLSRRAAAAAIVLADLPRGRLDEAPLRSIQRVPSAARLLRCFGRVVVGPRGLVATLGSMLDEIRVDPDRMADCVEGLPERAPGEHVAVVAEAVAAHAGGGALTFSRYVRDSRPVPTEVGWLEAIRMLRTFVVGLLTGIIRRYGVDVPKRLKEEAFKRANDLLFGEGSAYRLVLAPKDSPREAPTTPAQVASDIGLGAVSIPPHPEAWQQMRQAMFSLVDGCAAPPYVPGTTFNGRPVVVADPCLLTPPPGSEPPTMDLADQAVRALRTVPERVRSFEGAPDPSLEPKDETPEHEGPNDHAEVTAADRPGPVRSRELITSLDAYRDEQKRSFIWRVARHVAGAVDDSGLALDADIAALASLIAETHSEPASNSADEADPTGRHQKRSRRRRILRAVAGVLVLVGLLAGPAVAFVAGLLAFAAFVFLQIATIVFVVVRLALRWVRRVQRDFQLAHQLRLEAWELEQAANALVHDGSELVRLSACYDELAEWWKLLASFVHDPFSRSRTLAEEAPEALPAPLGVAVADALVSESRRANLGSRLGRIVFRTSWLANLFAEWAAHADQSLRVQRGEVGTSPGTALAADYDAASRRGDISRLAAELSGQDRSGVAHSSTLRFVEGLPTAEVFDPEVQDRRTAARSEVLRFLSGIAPGESLPPFDLSVGEDQILRQPESVFSAGLGAPGGRSIVAVTSEHVYRTTWRLDVGRAAPAAALRAPSRRTKASEPGLPNALPEI